MRRAEGDLCRVHRLEDRGDRAASSDGTIAVVVGWLDSASYQVLWSAAESQDGSVVRSALVPDRNGRRKRWIGPPRPTSLTQLADSDVASDVDSTVRYGGVVLTDSLTLGRGSSCVRALFPFAGGGLDPGAFTVEHTARSRRGHARLGTLIVISEPRLSALESRVQHHLPGDLAPLPGAPGSPRHWGIVAVTRGPDRSWIGGPDVARAYAELVRESATKPTVTRHPDVAPEPADSVARLAESAPLEVLLRVRAELYRRRGAAQR